MRRILSGATMASGLCAAMLIASPSLADTYTEVGDTGSFLGTAQSATGTGTLDSILGDLGTGGVDMFRIYVSDWTAFSATTNNATSSFDTQMFLFNSAGMGIAANDDDTSGFIQANGGYTSTLPVGNSLYSSLSPGYFFIAITQWDSDPTSSGGLIFPTAPFDGIVGPTGLGGGSAHSGWSDSSSAGAYRIDFTGVATIPLPPAAWAGLSTLAGVGLVGYVRRRRQLA